VTDEHQKADVLTSDLVADLYEFSTFGDNRREELNGHRLCGQAAEEITRLRGIEALARELVTTGMSLRFTSGPALSVIEKSDKSDPHYRLCQALELTARRART
jgi:hypothetical protein